MDRFIKSILTFATIFISVLTFLNLMSILTYDLYFSPSEMYYAQDFQEAFKDYDADMLILGNSKSLSSLDAKLIAEHFGNTTYHLGYSSGDIQLSNVILTSYLSRAKIKPNTIFLEVSWFTFDSRRTSFHSRFGNLFYLDNPQVFYPELLTLFNRVIPTRVMAFLSKLKHTDTKDYGSRFLNRKSPYQKNYRFEPLSFTKTFPNNLAEIHPRLKENFMDIIETCQNNSINIVLYSSPEDSTYATYQLNKKEIFQIYHSLEGIDFLDYTLGGDFYKKEFELILSDSHHINYPELFTDTFLKDLKSPRYKKEDDSLGKL